ncbi:hypothetical protein K8R04_02795 [Candidatus Uhrbacteria bacterium]|nr:hypothetical protein [Candidatus Uhrbacteria bacterium]
MKNEEILAQLKVAQGIVNRCITALELPATRATARKMSIPTAPKVTNVDFSLNARNFVKTYGRNMNGQKKFVLLLAYLTKGKTGTDVETGTITPLWGKMKAKELLGYAYNDKYPTAAKTSGWIDSKKHGTYHLRDAWNEIFS